MSDFCGGEVSRVHLRLQANSDRMMGVLEPTSDWGVPCPAVLRNSITLSHWRGAVHGKHSCGTYITRSRGAVISCQPVMLPYQEIQSASLCGRHSLLLANEARTENHLLWSVKPHFNARSVLFTGGNLACKWLHILKLFGT